jgi:hypothetical protein
MSEGRLPNFQQLAETGTFSDLATTLPPISPVAWSSFQTGVNPGKHNIYDFLNRDVRTYLPELSSARIIEGQTTGWRKWFGNRRPCDCCARASRSGKSSATTAPSAPFCECPSRFLRNDFFGLSLSAMCTPDLRGTQGSFTLFTTDPDEARATTGGLRILVNRNGERIQAYLPGPPKAIRDGVPTDFQTLLNIRVLEQQQSIEVRNGSEKIVVPLQKESDWLRIEYRIGWFTKVRGLCKLRLESLAPHFRLYVSPIHLDPERPAMPISHPLYFSMYLARLHDSFGTLGLAEDTWGLNSGVVGEDAFLEQAWAIHDERERMLFDSLRRMQRGLTVCVFDGPDRIQHMFWRHDVADHPANRGRDTLKHRHVIDDMYVRMDELIGRVRKEVKDDDFLFVISDHGFCDFSRGVNLNAWLRENGYLTLNEAAGSAGEYFDGVDWSRTKAYAFGLTGIYINQSGRESKGIVLAFRGRCTCVRRFIRKLTGLQDPDRQCQAVFKVHDCHQEYSGPMFPTAPM